jgi:hypothetical protein
MKDMTSEHDIDKVGVASSAADSKSIRLRDKTKRRLKVRSLEILGFSDCHFIDQNRHIQLIGFGGILFSKI